MSVITVPGLERDTNGFVTGKYDGTVNEFFPCLSNSHELIRLVSRCSVNTVTENKGVISSKAALYGLSGLDTCKNVRIILFTSQPH